MTRSFQIKRPHHGPLDCEQLSLRITPAITAGFVKGLLGISGDNVANVITLTSDAAPAQRSC